MKKIICLIMIICLLCPFAFADGAPNLSGALLGSAKQAVAYLASGEYERLVNSLPFSGVSPSASEWQSFAGNFSNLSNTQKDYAVGYWTGACWNVAVPVQVPDNGNVEVLVLTSNDGSAFSGYRYTVWSKVQSEYSASAHVVWNKEYMGNSPVLFVD